MGTVKPPARLRELSLAAFVWIAAAADVVAAGAAPACRTAQYSVVALPFTPTVISDTAVVAGTNELHRTIVWRRGAGARELKVPEGFQFTEPVAITRTGDVVVNALDATAHERRAFVYSGNSVFALAGNKAVAHGVGVAGVSGVVVGEWLPDGKATSEAVYWRGTVGYPVELCCGGALEAANRLGVMVGDAYDDRGRYHAFFWSAAEGARTIGPPDAYSSAVAINDAGHVLVQAGGEGYLYVSGDLRHLNLAPRLFNRVFGMNRCDVVVGGFGPDSDHYRALVWTATEGFRDLNSLIRRDSGWTLGAATAINDRGEIVGRGEFHEGARGFLLIPKH